MSDSYKRSLQIVLRHPAITLVVLIATIAATGYLFLTVPKGFFPQQDNGTVFGGMQGSQDASFQAMQQAALRVNDTIKIDPAVSSVVTFVGGNGATNSGFVYVALKPLRNEKSAARSSMFTTKLPVFLGDAFLQAGRTCVSRPTVTRNTNIRFKAKTRVIS
jgi:multidrug efflux pump